MSLSARWSAAGQEGLIFGDEAGNARAVDVAVAGEGPADREIVDRDLKDGRHRAEQAFLGHTISLSAGISLLTTGLPAAMYSRFLTGRM